MRDVSDVTIHRITASGLLAALKRPPRVTNALCDAMTDRRKRFQIKQVRLARVIGVDPTTLANWERGRSYPRPDLALAWVMALHMLTTRFGRPLLKIAT